MASHDAVRAACKAIRSVLDGADDGQEDGIGTVLDAAFPTMLQDRVAEIDSVALLHLAADLKGDDAEADRATLCLAFGIAVG